MLKLAPIFTDHAVLQREKPLRLFGTGTDGTQVVVMFPGLMRRSAPVHDGRWEITLPPQPAGGPYTIAVSDGTDTITLEDVMIGEVWLCGGQSNMEWTLQNALEPEKALETCETSNVRLYHVCKRGMLDAQFYQEEAASCWQLPTKDSCPHWSAIGYYYGVQLARKLGVTVGLVNCNYGGTSASAWVSRETLAATAVGRTYLDAYDTGVQGLTDAEAMAAYDAYLAYHAAWQERMNECYAKQPDIRWAEVLEICGENRYPGPPAPNNPLRPYGLYDTMIRRIVPYTLRGVLYYQGESDDHLPEGYYTMLCALIAQWRQDFRDAELPFILAQLPIYGFADELEKDNWCPIRAAQALAAKTLGHVSLAVLLDCGVLGDIHPKEKREPARRFYLQALKYVYQLEDADCDAPQCRAAYMDEGVVQLEIDHVGDGLTAKHDGGFELCGADGGWQPAAAEIRGGAIFVQSDAVPFPTAVRYAWRNYLEPSVFGKNGLPLAPFSMSC